MSVVPPVDAVRGAKASGNTFRPGSVALGLTLFVVLAALGSGAAGWFDGGPSGLLQVAQAMPVRLLAAALVLVLLDFLLGGLRLHLWLRQLEPGARYTLSFKVYLVNLLAAAISPMASASGPAQLAALVRGGVRPARAVAALLLTYVAILSSLLLIGGAAGGYLLLTTDVAAALGRFQRALLAGSVISAVLLVIALLNPRGGELAARMVRALGSRLGGRGARILIRWGSRIDGAIVEYRSALRAVRHGWKAPLAGCFGTSVLMLLNKFAIGFIVAIALGYAGSYLDVVARQGLQYLLLYFSPSPGQSGIAEASVPVFMAGIVPEGRWMEFALLWRGLTSYIGVAVGAVGAILVFGSSRRRAAKDDEAERREASYTPETATRSARCERDLSTQPVVPNSAGTKSGLGIDPG